MPATSHNRRESPKVEKQPAPHHATVEYGAESGLPVLEHASIARIRRQTLASGDILALQRMAGNRAVQRMIASRHQPAAAGSSPVNQRMALASSTVGTTQNVIQRKTALVSGKAHTRVVNALPTGADKKRAHKINRSKKHQLFNRFDSVELDDDPKAHILDGEKNVVWYRLKGTSNEYIRAAKVVVLKSLDPSGSDTEVEIEESGEGVDDIVGATEEMIGGGLDDPLIESLRGLELEEDREGELSESDSDKQSKLGVAEGVFWSAGSALGMVGGIMGMASSLKDLTDDESSTWDKVDAAFNLITSGTDTMSATYGLVGGVSSLVNSGVDEDSSAGEISEGISGWAGGWQFMWSALSSGIRTIKSVVDLVRMIVQSARDGESHGRDAWLSATSGLLTNALDTAKGVISSIRAIYELVSGTVTTAFEAVLPGIDIAIAAVKSIFQGYYLAVSGHQWWLMNKRKRELKSNLQEEGYGEEEISGARKFYASHEALIANYDRMIKKNEKAIESREDKIIALPLGKGEKSLKKFRKYRDEIEQLKQENKDLNTERARVKDEMTEYEGGNMQFDFSDRDYAPSSGQTKIAFNPTRMDLNELDLAGELASTNRKRVVRQSIHIGANLTKIAGSIVTLVAGPGAPAGVALKAAAAGIDTSLPFFRSIKQYGRKVAAKQQVKGRKGLSQKIFNANKSATAKLAHRKKQAVVILMMTANLNKFMPTAIEPKARATQIAALKRQVGRVEGYIRAAGCPPEKLYKANGNPGEQIKILVTEMCKRELGGD